MNLALAAENPDDLTGAVSIPMPLRVPDQTPWCLSTPGLRWARSDSVDLIGSGRQRPVPRGMRPPGCEQDGSRSPRLLYLAHHITSERKRFGASAPGARPQKTGARTSLEEHRAAVISFEWIAQGCTEKSFWTAPWSRLGGNDGAGRPVAARMAAAGPTESQ
jgi:hypothetical protein